MNIGNGNPGTEQKDIAGPRGDSPLTEERGLDIAPGRLTPPPCGSTPPPVKKGFQLTLPKSLLIWLSVIGVQLATGFVLLLAFIVVYSISHPHGTPRSQISAVEHLDSLAIISSVVGEIGILSIALVVQLKSSLNIRDTLSLRRLDSRILLLVPVICLSFFVISCELEDISAMVFGRTDFFSQTTDQVSSMSGVGGLVIGVIILGVIPGIVEETLFRGVMQVGLTNRYGAKRAIIVTSILFSILHINPTALLPIFAMSLVLGYIFYKTSNLVYSMVFHFLNNLVVLVLVRYSVSIQGISGTSDSVEHVNVIVLLVAIAVFAGSTVVFAKQRPPRMTGTLLCREADKAVPETK